MLYPFANRAYCQLQGYLLTRQYERAVEEQNEQEREEAWLEACAYNAEHRVNTIVDPFSPDGEDLLRDGRYAELLNPMGNGVMGYVDIPKIGQQLNIYHGTGEAALQQGVGHLQGTSLPVGGAGTHCVLSGHRGLATAELFTNLDQLARGDIVYLHVLGRTLAYQIDGTQTVLPTEVDSLRIVEGEDLLTLVTCTPYAVNTHRLLVTGHSVPYDPEAEAGEGYGMLPVLRIALVLVVLVGCAAAGYLIAGRFTARSPKGGDRTKPRHMR